MSRFHDYKMASNDTVAQHFAKVENMARQLKDLGENVSDLTIMAKVLKVCLQNTMRLQPHGIV